MSAFPFPELCHQSVMFTAVITITHVWLMFPYTYGENHCNVMVLKPLKNFFKLHSLWLRNRA